MSPQTICFAIGVIGVIAAIALGAAAVYVYIKSDIKSVKADLSGKTRVESISAKKAKDPEFSTGALKRKRSKSVLKDATWDGEVRKGAKEGKRAEKKAKPERVKTQQTAIVEAHEASRVETRPDEAIDESAGGSGYLTQEESLRNERQSMEPIVFRMKKKEIVISSRNGLEG